MPQSGMRERVIAPSGTYFVGALTQNAGMFQRIPLPESIAAGRHARCLIESLQIVSADQGDWDLWFWSNQAGQIPGDPASEHFLGRWGFAVAGGDGKQIGSTGNFYYYIDGLRIFYHDSDARNNPSAGAFLNVTLVSRSAINKSAAGFFKTTFTLEPTLD